jgi:hypothetical protein
MRETRLSGSEGGGTDSFSLPLYQTAEPQERAARVGYSCHTALLQEEKRNALS